MVDYLDESDPVLQIVLGLRNPQIDVTEYLQRLQALRAYGVGPPGLGPLAQGAFGTAGPRPDLWGGPPPMQFQPGAVLDPSQVQFTNQPAWQPWNRADWPRWAFYDPVGETSPGVGYPYGPAYEQSFPPGQPR